MDGCFPKAPFMEQHCSKTGHALHESPHHSLVSRRLVELSKGQSQDLRVLGGPVQQAIRLLA